MPRHNHNIFSIILLAVFLITARASGAEIPPFQGEITADNVRIRVDSTASAQTISTLNKRDRVEVISESYDWYKIRLPKNTPAYIKKIFITPLKDNTGEVEKTNVNVRLRPETKSPIIGKTNKGELLTILGTEEGWYKIEPPENSFGWVHTKFIKTAPAEPESAPEPVFEEEVKEKTEPQVELKKEAVKNDAAEITEDLSSYEGIVAPYGKVFRRITTHKLTTKDKKIYLLKGDKTLLNSLNYRKVKIEGNLIEYTKHKYPVIEVTKSEILLSHQ